LKVALSQLNLRFFDEILAFAPYGVMNPHPSIDLAYEGNLSLQELGKSGNHAIIKFDSLIERSIEAIWFFHNGEAHKVATQNQTRWCVEPQITRFQGRTKYRLKVKKVETGIDIS